MLDLKITGGTIVDGSGAARFKGDVGVKDGRIVAVGEVSEAARETVDATGRIVSPGFIDVHTHYDAQVFWDPQLSPSCFHGVTTVLGGFCGFSIAPVTPEAADYLIPMLARVEGMPIETLQKAVPWNWRSFGEYLDSFEGKVGLNAGFFAGHSAIRRVVMGTRAVGEKSTPEELETMKQLLATSLSEGALGFSTTILATHNDGDGNPVPSRWADRSEIVELASVVKDYEGTALEILPDVDWGPGMAEFVTEISKAGNRPINWNVLGISGFPNERARAIRQLSASDLARENGGEILALTIPATANMFVNMFSGFIFDANPGQWREIFKLPVPERIEVLRDPGLRAQLRADIESVDTASVMSFAANFAGFRVATVVSPANEAYVGRLLGDIAAEEGKHVVDTLLDIAIEDGLKTSFQPVFGGMDPDSFAFRAELWKDDRTLIGGSDAGAHMDMIDTFAFSTTLLEEGVRKFGVISLEEAVYQITDRCARYVGLVDRGLLKPGYHADIVIFDEATVGRGPTYMRYDVPGDQFRTYADARGVDHVFVNGVQIVRDGAHTQAMPGTVLRSGRDTRTVAIGDLREGRRGDLVAA
jgi:N-acyl-D-aspartate/D-glutamate deacylase